MVREGFNGILDYCDYTDMSKDPSKHFENKKVLNFDIIHHRDDPLEESYKDYQTVKKNDVEKYPKGQKKEVVGGLIRNFKRDDLFIERKIVKEHFKEYFYHCSKYLICFI